MIFQFVPIRFQLDSSKFQLDSSRIPVVFQSYSNFGIPVFQYGLIFTWLHVNFALTLHSI